MDLFEFRGAARPLTVDDVLRAAGEIDVHPAVIQAVAEIEAAGAGFLADGRPKILFEAHVFGRETHGRFHASHPNLSSPHWNRALYGAGGFHQWRRMAEAAALDRGAALRAASVGKFQIMGFNHALAGESDLEVFWRQAARSEGDHLRHFIAFIKATGLADELRDRRWADFARGYNGAGYAANKYDSRLAASFARHLDQAQGTSSTHPTPVEHRGRADVRAVQAGLNVWRRAAGAAALAVDGVLGPATIAAMVDFRARAGLPIAANDDDLDGYLLGGLGIEGIEAA